MKGPKRDKGRSKQNPKKTIGRKVEPRSYLGNYDSRKEKKKMIQSNVSGRNRKNKQDRPRDEHQSQGSAHAHGTNSDAARDERGHTKSTFFKKKHGARDIRSPLIKYQVSPRPQAKGGFLSKTDDLKFLKEISKDAKRQKPKRRSSAYPKEKNRMVHFAQNDEHSNLDQDPQTLLSSQNISEQREEERESEKTKEAQRRPKNGGISRSVVVGKRPTEMDRESHSHRETTSEVKLTKKKYRKKRSLGRREAQDPQKEKPPTWKFLKASTKQMSRTATRKGVPPQEPNERSKSIDQGPTYLANLQPHIQGPNRAKPHEKSGELDNFYVISSHQSNAKSESNAQINWSEPRNNQPAIGVEELHQSHPGKRNK